MVGTRRSPTQRIAPATGFWVGTYLGMAVAAVTGYRLLFVLSGIVLQMIGLALVYFFPQIALWLPRAVYG